MTVTLYQGDCLEVLPTLAAGSVDAVICDPPYGLSFMGKDWDHGVPGVHFWEAALRVAKPGAMMLAFGGTRTHHRLMCAIEDAGWEIRDCLMWLYGSGFPKSMDISKAIDKAAGAEREVVGERVRLGDNKPYGGDAVGWNSVGTRTITTPATDVAQQWQGWGTALKPAWEPIIMAMKPLDGTFANNALVHEVAGINVDGCRINSDHRPLIASDRRLDHNAYGPGLGGSKAIGVTTQGRWPANLLLDEEAAALLDEQSGTLTSNSGNLTFSSRLQGVAYGKYNAGPTSGISDSGGASRFFYVAKASNATATRG